MCRASGLVKEINGFDALGCERLSAGSDEMVAKWISALADSRSKDTSGL